MDGKSFVIFYLNLATEFASRGFNGISTFFFNQSEEERSHMLKLIDYVLESDETPTIPQYNYLESFSEDFDVLLHFQNSLSQEKKLLVLFLKLFTQLEKLKTLQLITLCNGL